MVKRADGLASRRHYRVLGLSSMKQKTWNWSPTSSYTQWKSGWMTPLFEVCLPVVRDPELKEIIVKFKM